MVSNANVAFYTIKIITTIIDDCGVGCPIIEIDFPFEIKVNCFLETLTVTTPPTDIHYTFRAVK